MRRVVIGCVIGWLAVTTVLPAQQAKPAPTPAAPASGAAALPVIVLDTVKGVFEIELFRDDAPKSVAHLLELVRKGFYRGLRFHRAEKNLVQFGDPLTKNMTFRDGWGTGGSGNPIGVAEISRRHPNVRGAVGLAYAGTAKDADCQFFILKATVPSYDGRYAVVGRVTKGMDVVDKIAVTDVVKLVTVK